MDRELNMDNQILYKLGGIESQVASIRDDITKVVRRLEERIDDDRAETDRTIALLKAQNDKDIEDIRKRVLLNETKIGGLEKWKDAWTTRSAWTLSIFGVVWFFLSEWVSGMIKGIHIG